MRNVVLFVGTVVLVLGSLLTLDRHLQAPAPEPEPYIVVEYLGQEFTEAEYHERVRQKIAEDGYGAICVFHLGTLAREARYLSVNSARQNLVYVTECARAGP